MLERFTYTNNFGETLEFGKGYLFVNHNDLRDFAWSVTSKNDRISSFKKGIVSKTIPIILKCNNEDEGIALRNNLFEVFEKDVLANKHGKIHIGDYYLQCFITGSKKTEYLIHKSYMVVTLTVQTDFPDWVKETTTSHGINSTSEDEFLDFPYDFPYDFMSEFGKTNVNNTNLAPCNFVLTIFGTIVNPTLYIGGHKYSVDVAINDGEYLTINSIDKTIVLTKINGEKVNCFNNRNKESYIFEKIQPGINDVTSVEEIHFNLTLLEERSEPKWT
jgi:hypothetical protein